MLGLTIAGVAAQQSPAQLPSSNLQYAAFTAQFAPGGVFRLEGSGWPTFTGTWKSEGDEVTLVTTGGPAATCAAPAKYRYVVEKTRVRLVVVADDCVPRRMILNESTWRPQGEAAPVAERRIVLSRGAGPRGVTKAGGGEGQLAIVSWSGRRRDRRRSESAGQVGRARPARTFSGRRRSPVSRTRARSCGAIGSL